VSLPFDATLKDIVQQFLRDYEQLLDLNTFAPLSPLNVDLSTISAATDIALGHGDPPDRIVDLNFQSGPDPHLDARVLMYNSVLHYRYHVPVHSVLILLRAVAEHRNLTGRLRYRGKRHKGKMDFSYEVVRLWQRPTKLFLTGGLGVLPLAPLCRLPAGIPVAEALAPIIRRIHQRLTQEATPLLRAQLLAATYVLLGLRVTEAQANYLFQGVHNMEDSTTYQAILAKGEAKGEVKGEVKGMQKTLLRQGRKRFGPASKNIQTTIQGITEVHRLERLTDRILEAASWQDLLAET
jgi:predicted transposase YdaD